MFKEFVYPLVQYFTPLNVFRYITFRAAYAAVTALLVCFVFGPTIIELLRRREMGEEIRGDGPETHLAKSGTPTMGGLMIILAITVSALLWMNVRNLYAWVGLLTIRSTPAQRLNTARQRVKGVKSAGVSSPGA